MEGKEEQLDGHHRVSDSVIHFFRSKLFDVWVAQLRLTQ